MFAEAAYVCVEVAVGRRWIGLSGAGSMQDPATFECGSECWEGMVVMYKIDDDGLGRVGVMGHMRLFNQHNPNQLHTVFTFWL